MQESPGRQRPAGTRHGNKWLTATLVEAPAHTRRLVARLERLGHTVVMDPGA